jgi:hypothetical protein
MEEPKRMTELEEGKEDWATYFCVICMSQFFNPLRASLIYKVKDYLNELLCKKLANWVTKNSNTSKLECTLCLGGGGGGVVNVKQLANLLLIKDYEIIISLTSPLVGLKRLNHKCTTFLLKIILAHWMNYITETFSIKYETEPTEQIIIHFCNSCCP